MKDNLKIRFYDEVPSDRFMPNSYTILPRKVAIKYAIDGYGDVEIPLLSKDFPGRQQLYEAGIYTEEEVKERLNELKDIDGIGSKTANKIKERFSAERVLNIHKEVKEANEVSDEEE